MTKILLVEDEPNMRLGLKDNLEFEGYEVDIACDGKEGYDKAINNKYDLILLDVMMPRMSGFDVCKNARLNGIRTPIILLTAKGEEVDKIIGLELGADDYITKPFSIRELLARIKAILRRTTPDISEGVIKIGRLEINFSSFTAFDEGVDISLSHREFEVLKYLYENKNQTVSRDSLLKNVWMQEATTTRTIDNFILKLRQKIETDPNNPKIILTVHGIGYKLIL
ncbi:MAG: response regulator transcription factor [Melioribacteraceae bacterium]|nr:response regulator transcription factor [Melioribacteraceae bacterium]